MQIGIQTWGSYGDVRPFLALAGGLAASGHQVTLNITSFDNSDYGETARHLGFTLNMVGEIEISSRENLMTFGRQLVSNPNPVQQLKTIMSEFFEPYADDMYRAALTLCENNDVVIGHCLHHPAQTAALKTDTPYVTVSLFHGMVPTVMRPPIRMPNLGKTFNRISWSLVRLVTNFLLKPYINRFRDRHALPRIKDCTNDVWISKQLNLIGVSRVFCQSPKDWDKSQQVCGFFDLPRLYHEGRIEQGLQAFIDAGDPPVFMGFGSMLMPAIEIHQEAIRIFMDAARKAGCRAIIQSSLWQECGVTHNEQFYFVKQCPHAEVFPQCVAVVHHGGSGTTQATTKAGVPSIVVIHLADQDGWAFETQRIGIAPRAIRRHKLTSDLLAKRIRTVLDSPDMQARAKQIGMQVRMEDGVSNAVSAIEKCFSQVEQ